MTIVPAGSRFALKTSVGSKVAPNSTDGNCPAAEIGCVLRPFDAGLALPIGRKPSTLVDPGIRGLDRLEFVSVTTAILFAYGMKP